MTLKNDSPEKQLKPCPFCGGEAKLSSWDDDWNSCRPTDTYWQVGCDTDGCLGESSYDQYLSSEESAIQAWNNRISGWHPIETAPKDGTVIDLWFVNGFRIPNCQWNLVSNSWAYYSLNGQWTALDVDGAETELTHWRPVPGGPED